MSSATYRPRMGYDIRINPERPRKRVADGVRCAAPGCRETADSKVAKSRSNPEDKHWLCREHLREHNRNWNFFAGMSDKEIETYCLDALTGHRPTWPLGKRAAAKKDQPAQPRTSGFWSYQFEDGYAVFDDGAEPARAPKKTRLTKAQIDALAVLNLEETASLHEIKARYKELVKRFHPDANGGDRGTEERLRQVIKAYGHLRASGLA